MFPKYVKAKFICRNLDGKYFLVFTDIGDNIGDINRVNTCTSKPFLNNNKNDENFYVQFHYKYKLEDHKYLEYAKWEAYESPSNIIKQAIWNDLDFGELIPCGYIMDVEGNIFIAEKRDIKPSDF